MFFLLPLEYFDDEEMSTMVMSVATTEEKMRQIQNAKAETEALRHQIVYRKNQVLDATLPEVASGTPPLGDLRLRGRSVFKGHIGKVYSMKLTRDNQYLVSAAQDGIVLVWDAFTTAKCEAVPLENTWVLACAVSPDNSILATGGLDNVCTISPLQEDSILLNERNKRRSRIRPRTPLCKLKGHRGYVSEIEFLGNDGQRVLTASTDMTVCLWDVEKGERVLALGDHLGDVNDLATTRDPNILASAAADNTVKLWDVRQHPPRSIQTFPAECELNSIDFFPDGNAVAAGGEDGVVRLYDRRCDCRIGTYGSTDDLNQAVTSVKFTPSGRLLVTGWRDGSFGQWDILKGVWLSHSPGHSAEVTNIQVADDGHRIYTSSWDSTLRAWEP